MSEGRGHIVIIIINRRGAGGICYRPSVQVDNGTTFFLSDCVIDDSAENFNVSISRNPIIGGMSINQYQCSWVSSHSCSP